VATILATMVLGQETSAAGDKFGGLSPILLPMVIAGIGIVFSIIGTFFVRISGEKSSVQKALNLGNWSSIILTTIASYFLVMWMLPENMVIRGYAFTNVSVFIAIAIGLVVGALMSIITEYYTAMGKGPVNSIIQKSATGHATNIIGGLAVGMQSTVMPIIVLAAGIMASYYFAGLYGVAIAAAGMMATTAMQLAIDAFGPIADNAGGIAEMSQLPPEVRERTDNLDAVGNTTAATGKGFAIASAALTSLALFAAFVGVAGISAIDIFKAPVLAMLFVGGMIPFVFSSLAIAAVGRAAMDMVNEVRRQFREIPGIMEYKAKPEYEKCVAISTKASIREMLLPGAIALLVPILVGFGFKGMFANASSAEMLGGLLAGVTVSGVLMGIFQNNAGGAWDNAKKSFEKGVVINGETFYKKSEPHKASVTGDTVGDPFKDTSGPSMNILIKLMSIVSLVIAPYIAAESTASLGANDDTVPAGAVAATTIPAGNWAFGVDSTVQWTGRKAFGQHFGAVVMTGGNLVIDSTGNASGEFNIDMKSITVADIADSASRMKLTGHLKSSDFFSVDSFPQAKLQVTKITPASAGRFNVSAKLTIKGITNDIEFPATILANGNEMIVNADITIDRTRWNIKYNSKSLLGDAADKFIYDNFDIVLNLKGRKS